MGKTTLIGDIGGTKSEWRHLSQQGIQQFTSPGFNAFTHSLDDFIEQTGSANIPSSDETFLYCAGADTNDQKNEIASSFNKTFNGKCTVENDLLGAARATCGRNPGYVCILGTGSNASFYNGDNVEKVSASLGYILGDEGSGAYLSKQLLKKVYREQLDEGIIKKFHDQYSYRVDEIITKIYNDRHPNRFLASFVPFIAECKKDAGIYQLIYGSFQEFFKAFFNEKPVDETVHFVGSVAFHFSDILRQVAKDLNFHIGTIITSPIAGLVLYHKNEE